MKNIVLLGGNGFIGRAFTDRWLLDDKDVTFYVLSRSGKNKINYPNIKNIPVDVTNYEKVKEVLPEKLIILLILLEDLKRIWKS
ncbi:NAD-dependent epimerase/dehydratase family protein [Fusobacterium polymorphum]|uniref:NAD-dependent epimerase/dehydratase family protein n=1 Tax=Fusobacterium nucleatum subsp. polymorphum TaxID=76857 RepID=UPI003008A4CB